MKKPAFKKLSLSAETIRNLTVAELGGVAGGILPINTTHSIPAACYTNIITTVGGDPAPVVGAGSGDTVSIVAVR